MPETFLFSLCENTSQAQAVKHGGDKQGHVAEHADPEAVHSASYACLALEARTIEVATDYVDSPGHSAEYRVKDTVEEKQRNHRRLLLEIVASGALSSV